MVDAAWSPGAAAAAVRLGERMSRQQREKVTHTAGGLDFRSAG